MNILVVDDEQIQLDNLSIGLKRYGYRVFPVLNAKKALAIIQDPDANIHMVITDYAMPEMSGLELLKTIREQNRDIPVIMMTACGEKDIIIEAMRYRCDSYIEKAFTISELMAEIRRAETAILRNKKTDEIKKTTRKLVHQINNPLMAIEGFAELSKTHLNQPDKLRTYLGHILTGAQKIHSINKVILLSANARWISDVLHVDAEHVLKDCLEAFSGLMQLNHIHLKYTPGGTPMTIRTNKFSLEQLFNNLLLNAINAMEGAVEKTLKVNTFIDTGNTGIINIADTGCGIPKETIPFIFKADFTKKKGGTGLGLAVAKEVVDTIKGEIDVSSRPGKGSLFTIKMPLTNEKQHHTTTM